MRICKFLCLSVVLALSCSAALDGAWTKKQLSPDNVFAVHADVAVSGSKIYTVWNYDYGQQIFFKRSIDNGATWEPRLQLRFSEGVVKEPAIAAYGANVYVVWRDTAFDPTSYWEIGFRRSTDYGATWQPIKRLTYTAGNSQWEAIAADGANVYVTWGDDTPGTFQTYFRRSADSGATWLPSQRLSASGMFECTPVVAANGSDVYVVWVGWPGSQGDIYFRKSTDGGTTWNPAKQLTANTGNSGWPNIAVNGSNVYVVYYDNSPGNYEIYLRKSTSSGVTWNAAQKITNTAGSSWYPDLAVSGSNLCLTWTDDTPGNFEIYYKKSANGGASWEAEQRLTDNAAESNYPAVAANNTKVYVAWQNIQGPYTLTYVKYSPL